MRAASSGQPLHRLARKLSPKSEVTAAQPGQSLPGSIGTVQSVNGDGTATVVYNGAPIPCQLFGDFVPVVGQGVFVLIEGTRNWCIGPVATAMQTWQNATLAADWSNIGSPSFDAQYRIVGDEVQLRGEVVAASGAGTTILTLPAGYRPQASLVVPIVLSSGVNVCGVGADGAVGLPAVSTGLDAWLDSVRFSIS